MWTPIPILRTYTAGKNFEQPRLTKHYLYRYDHNVRLFNLNIKSNNLGKIKRVMIIYVPTYYQPLSQFEVKDDNLLATLLIYSQAHPLTHIIVWLIHWLNLLK